MQIHQPIPHGLLYSVAPQNFEQFHLSEQAKHDDFEWAEHESEYFGETLAGNVIAFLTEISGK